MGEIAVAAYEDSALVVDSRLIAQELEINHSDWMQNIIKKYQAQTEQSFGVLRFENGKPEVGSKGGRPELFAWLTEEQSLFYVTLSKNSPRVVECKANLVKAFIAYRQELRRRGVLLQPHSTVYIQRLENMADHKVPDHLWTTFREGAEILLLVEKQYKVPVNNFDLCDGSIGSRWKNYCEKKDADGNPKSWLCEIGEYTHKFRDKRGPRSCNAYHYNEIPYFKAWLRDQYVPLHLPAYLLNKYGKLAVRQIYEEQRLLNDYIIQLTEIKRASVNEQEKYELFLAAREAIVSRYLPFNPT
ncbi:MAG: Rha family transcriptional regulator [Woronichinia naegeliana WA131]|uniref:Rha family transcriptional regulator n=1 Tax=Woronichinia naegeliana WA131 TaxID=2824559 RepID=A0A977PTQ5_9CYAN|nr:MAG: Rha family transcriptional regulator [Woronichinia naegeliana WA131]